MFQLFGKSSESLRRDGSSDLLLSRVVSCRAGGGNSCCGRPLQRLLLLLAQRRRLHRPEEDVEFRPIQATDTDAGGDANVSVAVMVESKDFGDDTGRDQPLLTSLMPQCDGHVPPSPTGGETRSDETEKVNDRMAVPS